MFFGRHTQGRIEGFAALCVALMSCVSQGATFSVPLSDPAHWQHLQYSNLPSNTVQHSPTGLTIGVNRSSSPLFFALPASMKVTQLETSGNLTGLPKLPKDAAENAEEEYDDCALRIGLVLVGEKTLSWLQRIFAPSWLKAIADLAPNKPFQKVLFLKLSQEKEQGFKRRHPVSKYFEEEVMKKVTEPGDFKIQYTLNSPATAFGIWIQADGDDTQSAFTLQLNSLVLTSEDNAPVVKPGN